MAFLTENVNITLRRTDFGTQSQSVVFTCDATMYPGDPGQNPYSALGPDPTLLTLYHIIILQPAKVKGMVRVVTGDELTVTALNEEAFGLDDNWRVWSDPMAYNGGKSFNKLNNLDLIVERVVA
jgi:hypothetical protein